MWGLLERTVAVECLCLVAGELKKSKADLQGLLPASEYSSLETFFSRTVEAAGDLLLLLCYRLQTCCCTSVIQRQLSQASCATVAM